jgi:tetratricopeptide (TPR) repeat protein
MRFDMTARFGPLIAALLFVGCKHIPTDKERQGAQIHYDLGVHAQESDPRAAFAEFETSLGLDPDFPEAHNAIGVVLHLAYSRPEEAIVHYRRAIELRPSFSEAKTNLANLYLDQKRYDEAITLYEEALNDMRYSTPFIAQGNLGWAFYKKGETKKAIDQIKAAVTTNPRFCLGHKNLGIIYEEQGALADSCKQFGKYREGCPAAGDAYFREGTCLAKMGEVAPAKKAFETCLEKTKDETLKDDCRRLAQQLGP